MTQSNTKVRENWGSRIGVILAVAGSAVGLGNFLRFPTQAAVNGGGAFMIPYLLAMILLGIPLAWVEWTLGRYGGQHSHGTGPGVYHRLAKGRPWAKYLGIAAIFAPTVITFYYVYIEGWTLAFSYYSLTGGFKDAIAANEMSSFFSGFIGAESNSYFHNHTPAIVFFLIVFVINYFVMYKGIQGGIEKLTRIGMPILIVCGILLAIRVLTLGTPDPAFPDRNVTNALGFMWNPNWSALSDVKVWLAATGQIFFSLSVGMGCIMAYASYLRKDDDVVLSSLTATTTNQFVEVVLGGSIGIVAAAAFYGVAQAQSIASSGSFSLGFITMPLIFEQIPFGGFFAFVWFLLLFIAGVTSSVSLIQPAITFLKDELDLSQNQAVTIMGIVNFLVTAFLVFTIQWGTLDEMDFWAATVCPVVAATIMVFFFSYVLGIKQGFAEMEHGAAIQVPRIFRFVLKYITPTYLVVLLVIWISTEWWSVVTLEKVADSAARNWIWGARAILAAVAVTIGWIVVHANRAGKFPQITEGKR
ncbi:MAG: sodium-dependent transporter [Calditrichaeota bacterium]|nr:sodium-dependent transporter [Calditrichota bacterium]MCB9366317.1 sodium-dependent transporter [Calditrichota bacterium]